MVRASTTTTASEARILDMIESQQNLNMPSPPLGMTLSLLITRNSQNFEYYKRVHCPQDPFDMLHLSRLTTAILSPAGD